VKANFLRLMQLVARGVPLPLGAVANRRSMIFVGNLADAIRACIEAPQAADNTYLASDGRDLATPELVRMLAQALGVKPRLLPVPPALLRAAGSILGRRGEVDRLTRSLEVDSAKLRRELAWQPPFTVEAGLAETAAWFRAVGSA
jgi:nucleoside-diphosphate-sugar epimerase